MGSSFINELKFDNYLMQKERNHEEVIVDDEWLYFFSDKVTKLQGWKGHISSQLKNSKLVAVTCVEYFIENNIPFKIAKNYNTLEKINDLKTPMSSANKFITIYPENASVLIKTYEDLFPIIGDLISPKIYTDRQLYFSSPFHYRYGAFKRVAKYDFRKNKLVYLLKNDKNEYVEDERIVGKYKPNWVQEPSALTDTFLSEKGKEVDDNYLSSKYELIGLLSSGNKGNVVLAVSKEDSKKVVIKEGRVHNSFMHYPYNSANLVRNEYKVLSELGYTDLAPKIIDFFTNRNNTYLIQEFIPGDTLTQIIKNKGTNYEKRKKIANDVVRVVQNLHDDGWVLGDISTNNFILSHDGVKIIDLESAGNNKNKAVKRIGSRGFVNTEELSDHYFSDDYALIITLISLLINDIPYFELNRNNKKSWKSRLNQIYLYAKNILDIDLQDNDFISRFFADYNILATKESGTRKHNIEMVNRIAKVFQSSHIFDEWLYTDFSKQLNPLSIQHGLSGGLHIISAIFDEQQMGILSNKIKNNIYHNTSMDSSYLFGRSGIFLSLFRYSNLDNSALRYVYQKMVTGNTKGDDLAIGSSGLGLVLLLVIVDNKCKWLRKEGKKRLQKIYSALYQKYIIEKNYKIKEWQDIGLAHGLIGIYLFLFYTSIFLRTKETKNILDPLYELRKTVSYFTKTKKVDVTWCNGLSGIISAFSMINYTVKSSEIDSFLKNAIDLILKFSLGESPCICHGVGSITEAVNDYAYFGDKDYSAVKKELLNIIGIKLFYGKNDVLTIYDETMKKESYDYGTGMLGIITTIYRLQNNSSSPFSFDKGIIDSIKNM